VIQTVFADTLKIEMSFMYLVIIDESLGECGMAYMNVNNITATLTLEMCMWYDFRFVSYFTFIDRQTEYYPPFLKEIEGVVNGGFRKRWDLPDKLAIDHVYSGMTEVVEEVVKYAEPLI
jgi:hypothetical protein